MKKLFSFIACVILVISCFTACSNIDINDEDTISIYVATDLHYFSPSLTDNGDLFMEMVDNADGKLTHYSSQINDAFFDRVITDKPDVLILSGDLTLNGSSASHDEFIEKVTKVQEAGTDVLIISGNHDVDGTDAVKFVNNKAISIPTIDSADFIDDYTKFGHQQAISEDSNSFSYTYQIDDLRIIMIDTNLYGKCFIRDETLQWVESELQKAKEDNVNVITVSHQNLYAHSELLSFGYQLYNAQQLTDLLVEYDVKCHLSGHIHIQSIYESDITEIATTALPLGNIQFGSVLYSNGKIEYSTKTVDVSGWAKKNNIKDENLLNFENYGVDYFKQNCYRQVNEQFKNSGYSDEQIQLLAKTFADINYAYFMGGELDVSDYKDGLRLWEEQEESFFTKYMASMVEAIEKEHSQVKIKL